MESGPPAQVESFAGRAKWDDVNALEFSVAATANASEAATAFGSVRCGNQRGVQSEFFRGL